MFVVYFGARIKRLEPPQKSRVSVCAVVQHIETGHLAYFFYMTVIMIC